MFAKSLYQFDWPLLDNEGIIFVEVFLKESLGVNLEYDTIFVKKYTYAGKKIAENQVLRLLGNGLPFT